ncbi:MAG: AzlC family ABC transporter permease [Coriobacteriia bacterium]|nr:AzlC family ABC transporter permease [Coriobacteriia bacterium]
MRSVSESASHNQTVTDTRPTRRSRFARGLRLGLPIFLGYMPVGMAFGVIATSIGFSIAQAGICSATALAGAGQFIALGVLKAGEGVIAVLVATTVVNLRYVLFGATLSPHVRGMHLPAQALLAFTLTDETFAVNMNDRRQGLSTGASMAGVGAIAWSGWVGGTVVGAATAAWIGDPRAWGVDFAMAAMFTALLVAMAETRRHLLIGAVAGATVLALPELARLDVRIGSSWFVVIAAVAAATLGVLAFDE